MYCINLRIVDQNLLSSNQKTGFFDHQYLWNETINILDFLHEYIYQRKETSKNDTVGWMQLGVPNFAEIFLSLSERDFDLLYQRDSEVKEQCFLVANVSTGDIKLQFTHSSLFFFSDTSLLTPHKTFFFFRLLAISLTSGTKVTSS